ncbi:MAG: hypothetical protein ACK4TL_15535 [Hyphomicrobiaceae bacterium]
MPTPIMLGPTGRHPRGSQRAVSFDAHDRPVGIGFVLIVLGFFAVSEVFIQGEWMVTGVRRAPTLSLDFPLFARFWRLKIAAMIP